MVCLKNISFLFSINCGLVLKYPRLQIAYLSNLEHKYKLHFTKILVSKRVNRKLHKFKNYYFFIPIVEY